jgi:hypothetical protein
VAAVLLAVAVERAVLLDVGRVGHVAQELEAALAMRQPRLVLGRDSGRGHGR